MKRIQTLIQSLLLVSALTFSGSAYAGFNFGGDSCADGSGTFSQAIPHNETAEVGVIPVGMSNVKVDLTSSVDVDIQLIDVLNDTPIVHWQTGVVKGGDASCAIYKKVEYCYSGYAGVNGQAGNEYIHINGTTNREVKMLAYGYAAGDAQVDYSWEAPTGCVDAGSGEFDQTLIHNDVVEVGTIPAGKENIQVNLESDADVDIEIYHGDKAIVAWTCFNKPNHADPCLSSGSASTVDYEGMTLSYSGFNGVNGQAGHEFIKIEGALTQPLTVKAFAYAAGTAKVTYSWGPNADDGTSAPADGTSVPANNDSTPVDGESTPSNTPDPASYCSDNMGFDSGINMCIIQPEYTAAKDQCDADLTAANTAKSSCESAKQTCETDLTDANTAKSSCEANLAQETEALEAEIALTLGYEADILNLTADLNAANTAKTSCESTLAVTEGEKTDAMSDLATCQFDLTEAQAVEGVSGITNNCTSLNTPANGSTVFSEKGLKSTQTFTCDADYHLEGSASLGCTLKQQTETSVQFGWNHGQPTCLRVCPEPMKPTNGFVTKTKGNLEGSVLSYTCDTGYLIEGTDNGSTCQADGTWSIEVPACQKENSLAEVIIYQFELGELDLNSGVYASKLKGDDGSVVDCETDRFDGSAQLEVRDQQLKGRIAIYGLAADINTIYLNDNSITSLVGIDRTGEKTDWKGTQQQSLVINLGGAGKVSWNPLYGNLNFDGNCPNELTMVPVGVWAPGVQEFFIRHNKVSGAEADFKCLQ